VEASAGRRRRKRTDSGENRTVKLTVRFSPAEAARVTESAGLTGLSAAAYIGQAAVCAATGSSGSADRIYLDILAALTAGGALLRDALGQMNEPGPDVTRFAAEIAAVARNIDDVSLKLRRRL
jgi:hypothetical protein